MDKAKQEMCLCLGKGREVTEDRPYGESRLKSLLAMVILAKVSCDCVPAEAQQDGDNKKGLPVVQAEYDQLSRPEVVDSMNECAAGKIAAGSVSFKSYINTSGFMELATTWPALPSDLAKCFGEVISGLEALPVTSVETQLSLEFHFPSSDPQDTHPPGTVFVSFTDEYQESTGYGTCEVESTPLAPGTLTADFVCRCGEGFVADPKAKLKCIRIGVLEEAERAKAAHAEKTKKYRVLSVTGNLLTDTSMALLVSSHIAFIFYMLSGFAGGACDEEATSCPYEERTFVSWMVQLGIGMSLFAAGFPILDSATKDGVKLVSAQTHFHGQFYKLRAASWFFYTFSLASTAFFAIVMPYAMWVGALILQPFALAFAATAAILNFTAWHIVLRKARDLSTIQPEPQAVVLPFLSPVDGGFITGIGGTFK